MVLICCCGVLWGGELRGGRGWEGNGDGGCNGEGNGRWEMGERRQHRYNFASGVGFRIFYPYPYPHPHPYPYPPFALPRAQQPNPTPQTPHLFSSSISLPLLPLLCSGYFPLSQRPGPPEPRAVMGHCAGVAGFYSRVLDRSGGGEGVSCVASQPPQSAQEV